HAVLGRPGHESRQGGLKALADRLEAVELGVEGDRGDELPLGIEPERLAAPDEPADAVSIELDALPRDLDGVAPSFLDSHRATRERLQRARTVRTLPVADEHHLDRHGREAAGEEEAVGHGPRRRNLPLANGRGLSLNFDLAVDSREP